METNFNHWFGLQLHLTDDCDQRCSHCYIFNDPNFKRNQLSVLEVKNIIENFERFCLKMKCNPSITLTGGDPLLHENIWEILNLFACKNIPFDILGNPFHLNQTTAKKLFDLGCQKYQLSIDGLEETHDKLRKKGSFQETIRAIEVLNSSGIRSHVMMTVSKLNYFEVKSVVHFLSKSPVAGFAFARYFPTLLDKGISNISPEEYREFLASVWDTYKELSKEKTKFFLKDHLWTPFLYEKGLLKISKTSNIIYEGCGCAIRHMCVLPNGQVYSCRRFQSPIGNCLQQKFWDIFWGDAIAPYRDYKQMECYNCELFNYCRGCPAVSYGTYGSFYKKDPQCWRIIQ